MALRRQDAVDAVLRTLSSECAIVPESIVELERHWMMNAQSKRYIETRDFRDMLIGEGPILVHKGTGRLTHLGSAPHYFMQFDEMYEGGCFEHENPDIVVTAVDDIDDAARSLAAMRAHYVIPEVVGGCTFRIPQDYTVEQLHAQLSRLPYRLNVPPLDVCWPAFKALKSSGRVQFRVEENAGFVNPPPLR